MKQEDVARDADTAAAAAAAALASFCSDVVGVETEVGLVFCCRIGIEWNCCCWWPPMVLVVMAEAAEL